MTALLRAAASPRRTSEAPRRPSLRVVERPAPRPASPPGRNRRLSLVSGGLIFAAVLAGNVAVHAQTTQGQFELERLQTTAGQRQARYQQLRLQVAELEAPQRVVERARQMGMVEPARVTYLTPTAATSTGDTGDTRPAGGPADVPTGQAAGNWSNVKPHLDGRR